jgi:hypothetical protein
VRKKALLLPASSTRPRIELKPVRVVDGSPQWIEWQAELASRATPVIRELAEKHNVDFREAWKLFPLLVDFVEPETRGRPVKVTSEVLAQIDKMTSGGKSKQVAAELVGVHRDTVRRHRKPKEK